MDLAFQLVGIFFRFKRVGPLIVAHTILDSAAFVGYALLRGHLAFLGF